MNNPKYKELIEEIKTKKSAKEKTDSLATMVFMMATNDLDCIYSKITRHEKQLKKVWIGIICILIAIAISNPKLTEIIFNLIAKLL